MSFLIGFIISDYSNSAKISIQSKAVIENDLPVIVISRFNYSNENYFITVIGVEYTNMYSTTSALYEIDNGEKCCINVNPTFRTDDCLNKSDLSYTVHIYKNKNGNLEKVDSKTINGTDKNFNFRG